LAPGGLRNPAKPDLVLRRILGRNKNCKITFSVVACGCLSGARWADSNSMSRQLSSSEDAPHAQRNGSEDTLMFLHRKELIQPVNVGVPNAKFGIYLLEQFGGATGELTAALQYWVQSFHVEDAGIRDMLQDIAIEEFSHLEMVGKLIAQHTSKLDQESVNDAPLFKLKGGGPHFLDSQGSFWTAAYIQEGGNVVRDLRANISAEAGARQTYEALIKASDDEGTKKTLHHLLTREITHANMFMKALDGMGKLDDPYFGNVPPDETVKLVFNLSRGQDVRGPWNEEPNFEYVADPQPEGGLPPPPVNADDEGHGSHPSKGRTK
jgi:Mn-containing catalase